ncbi:MAG: hypothetical protein ACREAU_00175 [Nitrosopumilaceae archaeon]
MKTLTFKQYLTEISSMQAARFSVLPRTERIKAAQISDREARIAMQTDIAGMEKSADSDERMLARKMKEVAILRAKVTAKRQKAETMQKQQAGNEMGTGQQAGMVDAAGGAY